MDLDWGPDEGSASGGFMAESPILFLHCWDMKDVRISLSLFYFVITIHRPAELGQPLVHLIVKGGKGIVGVLN